MTEERILDRLDAQEKVLSTMLLSSFELDHIRRARHFLYTSAIMGGIIGAAAGTVMTFGKHSGRLTKVFITVGSAGTGITLGTALGVQTGMQKLLQLNGSLGEELRYLEALRSQLRRRGTHEKGPFQGPAVEAERQRLAGTLLQQLMWIAFRVHSNDFRLSFFDFIGMFNKRVAG